MRITSSNHKPSTLLANSQQALKDLAWGWQLAFNIDRRLAGTWLLLSVLGGLAPMAMLLSARHALQELTDTAGTPESPLSRLLLLVLGMAALVYVLAALGAKLRGRLATAVQTRLLDDLLDVVNRQPPEFFDDNHRQDLLHRARSDALAQPQAIFEASGGLLQTGLYFCAILVFLGQQSWVYPALLLAAALPAVLAFGMAIILGHRSRRADTHWQRIAGHLLWILTNRESVPELRLTGLDRRLTGQHSEIRERLDRNEQRRESYQLWASLLAGLGMLASLGIGLWWMLHQFNEGTLPVGTLAVSFYAFITAHRMAGSLLEVAARLYRGGLFLGDLRNLFGLQTQKTTETPRASPLPLLKGITIEDLGFRYPGSEEWVLRHLNLEIPAGKVTLLTGANGRGKSTLLKLIAGLYQPQEGRILIDGIPLAEIDPAQWQASLSLMFQDPARLPGSLRENVELGREGAPAHWPQAQGFGQLEGLIGRLPHGEGTRLFQSLGGHDLSGGEWQRVALARAMATDAPLLILDEPTSALDPATRTAFWATLENYSTDRTVLLASHDSEACGGKVEL